MQCVWIGWLAEGRIVGLMTRVLSTVTLLTRLNDMGAWVTDLGIKRGTNDRLTQISRLVEEAEIARVQSRQPDELPIIGTFDNYIYAMAEALEFTQIYEAFRRAAPELIAPKLRRALDGPFRLANETRGNSVGRNTAFELALAAEWSLRGAEIEIGEPDITLHIGEVSFVVECKRPLRIESVRTNLRAARDQLASVLDQSPKTYVGMIAVSVSRIFTGGVSLFRAHSEADVDMLTEELELFLDRYKHEWGSLRMDSRIGAVLFHLSIPTDVADHDHFALLSCSNLYPATDDRTHIETLQREMARLYAHV